MLSRLWQLYNDFMEQFPDLEDLVSYKLDILVRRTEIILTI